MNLKIGYKVKSMNKFILNSFFVSILIALMVIFLVSFTGCITIKPIGTVSSESVPDTVFNDSLKTFNSEISSIVAKITPSVVNIDVTINQQGLTGQATQGVGAGIIYSPDGYIITNNHVAGDADEIMVTLSDGTSHDAVLIGADASTDIAVIKIEATNLIPAQFASENDQKVGDLVLAVGSPFGVQQTITHGIISGLDRNVPVSANTLPLVNLIQTDAPINPGNSGGPLININGEVIGMNSIGYTTSGSSAGIGFAIPTDTILAIAEQIIQYGEAQIPYIGIEIGDNTSNINGVLIGAIMSGGPAEKAGLRAGDIITELNGEELLNPYDLYGIIIENNVGDILSIKYYRNGNYITGNITLEKKP